MAPGVSGPVSGRVRGESQQRKGTEPGGQGPVPPPLHTGTYTLAPFCSSQDQWPSPSPIQASRVETAPSWRQDFPSPLLSPPLLSRELVSQAARSRPSHWGQHSEPLCVFSLFKILSWLVFTPGGKDKPW